MPRMRRASWPGSLRKSSDAKLFAAAGIVLATFAGTEQHAAIVAGRRLARLHIEMIGVQGRLAGNRYPALIGAEVKGSRRHTERGGEEAELAARAAMEEPFGVGIVGDALTEIESDSGRGIGHGKFSESGDGKARRRALSASLRADPLPAAL